MIWVRPLVEEQPCPMMIMVSVNGFEVRDWSSMNGSVIQILSTNRSTKLNFSLSFATISEPLSTQLE